MMMMIMMTPLTPAGRVCERVHRRAGRRGGVPGEDQVRPREQHQRLLHAHHRQGEAPPPSPVGGRGGTWGYAGGGGSLCVGVLFARQQCRFHGSQSNALVLHWERYTGGACGVTGVNTTNPERPVVLLHHHVFILAVNAEAPLLLFFVSLDPVGRTGSSTRVRRGTTLAS